MTGLTIILDGIASILILWLGLNVYALTICGGAKDYEKVTVIISTLFILCCIWL